MGWKPLDGIFEPTLRLQEPAPEEATVEGGSTVGADLAKFGLIAARGSGEGSFWLIAAVKRTCAAILYVVGVCLNRIGTLCSFRDLYVSVSFFLVFWRQLARHKNCRYTADCRV